MSALDASTGVDLSVAWFRANVAVIAAVTLPMVVGLLVAQVVAAVIRREPGGLGRAVVGVAKALIGASLALAVTQLALSAVDGICEFIAASAGMTVATAAATFLNVAAWAATSPTPVLSMLLGLAVIVGCVLLWGVLLFRKAALILVAVFAPVAFAGQVWDQTRVWTRRWIEVVAALVLCKVVIVVVFVVGASAFTGTGPGGAGATGRAVGGGGPVRPARRAAAADDRGVRAVVDVAVRALVRDGSRRGHALRRRGEPRHLRGARTPAPRPGTWVSRCSPRWSSAAPVAPPAAGLRVRVGRRPVVGVRG